MYTPKMGHEHFYTCIYSIRIGNSSHDGLHLWWYIVHTPLLYINLDWGTLAISHGRVFTVFELEIQFMVARIWALKCYNQCVQV